MLPHLQRKAFLVAGQYLSVCIMQSESEMVKQSIFRRSVSVVGQHGHRPKAFELGVEMHQDKVTNRFISLCHGGAVACFARIAGVAGTFGCVQVRLQMHRQYVVAFVAILQQSDANTRLLVVRAGVFSLVLSMRPIDILNVLNPLDGIQELLLRVCVGLQRGMFVELANGERAQSLGFFCAIFHLCGATVDNKKCAASSLGKCSLALRVFFGLLD